ncbi:zinc finger protein 354B-like [Megalops cyprinoides]|uniref:zinc finger protein 354B-like n=1 Tax=Megalops cyprinoides TaxID=118141 RepID=UPI0018640E37|nr:zinc finger protein 354B-like [Megalops cyprinoides]
MTESKADLNISYPTNNLVTSQQDGCEMAGTFAEEGKRGQTGRNERMEEVKGEMIEATLGVGQHTEAQEEASATSWIVVKRKKKARRLKKKTFKKPAKQIAFAVDQGSNSMDGNQLENNTVIQDIFSHQSQRSTEKKVRKKAKLATLLTTLRRYSRACKVTPDYTVSKIKEYHAHNLDMLASSDPVDPPLPSVQVQTKQDAEVSLELEKSSETVGSLSSDSNNKRKLDTSIVVKSTAPLNTSPSLDTPVTPFQEILTESGVLSPNKKPRKVSVRRRHTRKRFRQNDRQKEKAALWNKQVNAGMEELSSIIKDVQAEKSVIEVIEPHLSDACSTQVSFLKLAVTQEAKSKQGEETGELFEDAEEGQGSKLEQGSVETVTAELNSTTQPSKLQVPGIPLKKGQCPTKCRFCGRSFRHISAYIIHRRIHTGEKPYRCQECGKSFAQLSDLKAHRNVHRPSGCFQCPFCTSRFSHRDELLAHILIHADSNQQSRNSESGSDGARTKTQNSTDLSGFTSSLKDRELLVCLSCGKSFSHSGALKVHMRIHRREKPFSCKVCGKAFRQASSLSDHEKTHWQVQPYACSVCWKGFSQLAELKTHSRTHTGEKPYCCALCGDAFHQLSFLRSHQASKVCLTKEVGGDADKSIIEDFLVLQGLDGHINPPVAYECQICCTSYNLQSEYSSHLLTHSDVQTDSSDVNKT